MNNFFTEYALQIFSGFAVLIGVWVAVKYRKLASFEIDEKIDKKLAPIKKDVDELKLIKEVNERVKQALDGAMYDKTL